MMELERFVKDFANQLDETDPETVTASTVYKDLDEWSSFLALAIMAMIKSEYDVAVNAQEMRDAQTIQDLFNVVQSHV